MSARLVEIYAPTSSRDSDGDFLEGFCLDLLVHKTTFGSCSIEGSHELLNVSDRIGVLATTSKGNENLTISSGAHGFDCGGSKSVDHNLKKRLNADVF
mgnify:CR=1 FL=1